MPRANAETGSSDWRIVPSGRERRLERELAFYRSCLEHAPVVLAHADEQLRYRWVHDPHGWLFDEQRALGCTAVELADHEGAHALHDLERAALHTAQRQRARLRFPGPTQRDRPCYDVRSEPVFDDSGAPAGVRTVAVALDPPSARAHARDARADYLQVVAHDLRGPLSVIGAATDAIEAAAHDGDATTVSAVARKIQRNVQQMAASLEEVLELGRLESGTLQVHPEPVAPDRLLRDAVRFGLTPDQRQRVQLMLSHAPGSMRADRAKLQRAVLNLIQNALKFSPHDTQVEVGVRREPERGWRIWVHDTGPGMDPETARAAFDKYQSSRASQRKGGFGLGLYSCRLIVEAHGGACWVESQPGQGATFVIQLPD